MFDSLLPYIPFATMIASGGVAWGVSTQKLKRTEKDIDVLFRAQEHHQDQDHAIHKQLIDRLARIETKIDILMRDKV